MMNQRVLFAIIGILVAGLATAGLVSQASREYGLGAAPVAAQQAPGQPSGITVLGEGDVRAQPDQAFVRLGVQTRKPTAKEAMDENSRLMNAVIDAIKNLGIAEKDIRTGNVSLYPEMGRPGPMDQRPPEVVGYRASNEVIVTADAGKAGDVLDAGVASGANVSGGVQFGFRDADKLRREALGAAMKDARAKADVMAAGLDVKVGSVASVMEESVFVPRPGIQAFPGAMAPEMRADTPIQPGEQQIVARARVTFNFQ